MRIVTHNGPFHSDDVFAVAALFMRFGREHELLRTRDPEIIASADIVVDVGQEYDEARMRFDHHQGPPLRENGVPYASFGLVWKKFGAEIAGSDAAVERIDRKLVQPIDAADNSIEIVAPALPGVIPYIIQDVFNKALRPTWLEEQDFDGAFKNAVDMATIILKREISWTEAKLRANKKLQEAFENASDKRILVLDRHYPHDSFAMSHPEILFAVFPGNDGNWNAKTIAANEGTYESRKDFPESWAGLRNADLQKAAGVADAVFCHRGRFLVVAQSREGAVKLAELALAN